MDEARAVLERLRRIDALQCERAGPHALLAELDELVVEVRRWLGAEGGDERAAASLARVGAAVERTREAMMTR
jgi:hypothetical protein